LSLISTAHPLQPQPQFASSAVKKLCRHCGEPLIKAKPNPRDRFCCGKCEESFYRTNCRVCERPIVGAKNSRRQLCGRHRCRLEFRRHQGRFYRSGYPYSGVSPKRDKTSTKSTAFLAENGGGTWAQIAGPTLTESAFRAATVPLDPELVARHARDRKAAITERNQRSPAPLIGPHDPPANIVGGFRFPGAPEIDLSPAAAISGWLTLPISAIPIPADLSIPEFLRRASAASEAS
jgi:hypothetical protein